ncbi:MAG TPA: MBL fold metallo-hydrolase [Solirubrobacterales bacterium]|nr:MBL fold metallo-hydrolase [Solirubrobacterales bacterium]
MAEQRLDRLGTQMREEAQRRQDGESEPGEEGLGSVALADLVETSRRYNRKLGRYRYASNPWRRQNMEPPKGGRLDPESWPAREPLPDSLPLTDVKRFAIGPDGESVITSRWYPWASEEEWNRIPRFYSEAIGALALFREQGEPGPNGDRASRGGSHKVRDERNRRCFARSLVTPRDGASDARQGRTQEERLGRRIERYEDRFEKACRWIGPGDGAASQPPSRTDSQWKHDPDFLAKIIGDDLNDGDGSLPIFVLRVHAEAHLSMHAVEAWRLTCLGEHAQVADGRTRDWLDFELDRSAALSTFAYCISRTAPWLFAKSEEERRTVIENVRGAWENLVPVRCMWIANQIGLLSLHRRAYAHALKKDGAIDAYNDYHKLHQLIRDAERRVRAAPVQVDGALEFLAGLDAEAHHHIGELYRSEHAHKPALQHFKAATHRLDLLRKEDKATDVLSNSRWNVELHISYGKACYEMGRHKEALSWHLRAWRAFLELLSGETNTAVNTEDIEGAIDWLESVRFEPELRKFEISERLRPVVDQLDRISVVGRLGALAAEILLRLGHLLFVLNLGYDKEEVEEAKRRWRDDKVEDDRDRAMARERIRRTLGFACLAKADECDPHSTLIGTDLLKARFRFNKWWVGELSPAYEECLRIDDLERIIEQWPRGGDDFERLARVAEYLMLRARRERFSVAASDNNIEDSDALLARDLMLDLFMSTDSINVRKSQIHRFLMKEKLPQGTPLGHRSPSVELICMRRYSSPFPLLPRPSAFRALGGGYFLRLHERDADGHSGDPYGVVVDPGVDFVENLYRSGYSLGDIDMILITHDHVDHLGGLDPLLSLLHVRSQILSKQKGNGEEVPDADKVRILTSTSVTRRYDGVTRLQDEEESKSSFCFVHFEPLKLETGVLKAEDFGERFPKGFEIVAMSSAAGAEDEASGGHRDLSDEPSHGVCFRAGRGGPSVAITSDTPPPPSPEDGERYESWRETWEPALNADVLVAHLGSVPLTELRQMDSCEESGDDRRDANRLRRLQRELEEADPQLRGQIEYAHWLRTHRPKGKDGKLLEPVGDAPLAGALKKPWRPPPEHNFLAGIVRWAREYASRWRDGGAQPQGLFIAGELSEELGTMRGKVATRLNQHVFEASRCRGEHGKQDLLEAGATGFPYALTADIGLHVCVARDDRDRARVEVLCTTCNLDSDRSSQERYHPAHDVYEVCVKGENEGIFYNCLEHDPARQDEPTFLERLERFDIFGR